MVALLSSDDSAMPLSLKVEAVSEIGKTNLKYILKIVQELNKAICTSLHEYWLDGNSKLAERAMLLLECYAVKVLPWFDKIEVTNNVPMHFALKIWDEIQVSTIFSDSLKEKKLLEIAMNAMKHTVASCSELIPLLIDGLTILSEDVQNRDIVYNLLLVLSGLLTDKNGQEAIVENAYIIIRCLNKLVFYHHMMLVRETTIQRLTAMSELPYATVYRFSTEVLQTLSRALDDPKRSVRQEAVKCQHAWFTVFTDLQAHRLVLQCK